MINTKSTKDTKTEEAAAAVVHAGLHVHRELGPGLLESVYEKCLAAELAAGGHEVDVQKAIPVTYRHFTIEAGFRADLIIDRRVLVELKAIEALQPIHTAQVLTYLRLAKLELGLLINFNVRMFKDGIRRVVLSILVLFAPFVFFHHA